ncbi:DUF4365 domain-containing protein [Fimbriiglobus ruber]|uniref:DUF4365 domain-containing protein n=1 Tax=Fimbriiglobus ruber TaxID=1908690 RepID=A0A225DGH5_9BACT|nr:DUF4365 domain-containing protein [Fimbriiglobus ruber]OWK36269.1 hypothetical protein FRUB_08832 [Fimbriiglobus ruber]
MTPEQQMEQFSLAYVRAVAAAAGVNVARPEVDSDSVDLMFSLKSVRDRLQSPILQAQIKCTAKKIPAGIKPLRFELKLKNYTELIGPRLIPKILIVVCVPPKPANWLTQDEKSLALMHCGYFVSLANRPDTPNERSVTVRLPRENLFSVAKLRALLEPGGLE